MNLTKNVKFSRVSNGVTAGTSAVSSSAIDMRGFFAYTFQVLVGAIAG